MPCFCPMPVWRYSKNLDGKTVIDTKLNVSSVKDKITNAVYVRDDFGFLLEKKSEPLSVDDQRAYEFFCMYHGFDEKISTSINFQQAYEEGLPVVEKRLSEVHWHDRYTRYKHIQKMTQYELQIVQNFMLKYNLVPQGYLPCGYCEGCSAKIGNDWALRCELEMSMHDSNCFVTLTYDDQHLPADATLIPHHLTNFFKLLRKKLSCNSAYCDLVAGYDGAISYLASGEYGSQARFGRPFGRPHYHAIIFGLDFPDKIKFRKSDSGYWQYTSDFLSSCWKFGDATVGETCNFSTARYVARYVYKDMFIRDFNVSHFDEIYQCLPPFRRSSNRPAIGQRFFDRYLSTDIYNPLTSLDSFNRVISVGGKVRFLPRFFEKRLKIEVEKGNYDHEKYEAFVKFKSERARTSQRLYLPENLYKSRVNFLSKLGM